MLKLKLLLYLLLVVSFGHSFPYQVVSPCSILYNHYEYAGSTSFFAQTGVPFFQLAPLNFQVRSLFLKSDCQLTTFSNLNHKYVYTTNVTHEWAYTLDYFCCECGGCESDMDFPQSNSLCARVYEEPSCSFCSGTRIDLRPGDVINDLSLVGNTLRSVKIKPGCKLHVFSNPYNGGLQQTFSSSSNNLLKNFPRISSLQCICGFDDQQSGYLPGGEHGGNLPGGQHGGNQPGGEHGGNQPGGQHGGNQPGGEHGGNQHGGQHGGNQPGGEHGGNQPGGQHGGNQPGGQHGGNQPGGEHGGNQPGGQHGGNQPGGQHGGNQPGGQHGGNHPGGEHGGNQPGDNLPARLATPEDIYFIKHGSYKSPKDRNLLVTSRIQQSTNPSMHSMSLITTEEPTTIVTQKFISSNTIHDTEGDLKNVNGNKTSDVTSESTTLTTTEKLTSTKKFYTTEEPPTTIFTDVTNESTTATTLEELTTTEKSYATEEPISLYESINSSENFESYDTEIPFDEDSKYDESNEDFSGNENLDQHYDYGASNQEFNGESFNVDPVEANLDTSEEKFRDSESVEKWLWDSEEIR